MDRSFNALIEVLSWKPLPSQRRMLRPPLLALFSSSVLCIISLLNPNLPLCTFTHLLQWVDLAHKTLTRSSTRSRSKLMSDLFRPTYRNGDVPWWFAIHLYLLPNLGWLLWQPMCCLWYTSLGQAVLLSRPPKKRSSHDQNHTYTHTHTHTHTLVQCQIRLFCYGKCLLKETIWHSNPIHVLKKVYIFLSLYFMWTTNCNTMKDVQKWSDWKCVCYPHI